MPKNLKRVTGRGDLHFITFCCYQRRALLATMRARNLAVQILGLEFLATVNFFVGFLPLLCTLSELFVKFSLFAFLFSETVNCKLPSGCPTGRFCTWVLGLSRVDAFLAFLRALRVSVANLPLLSPLPLASRSLVAAPRPLAS